MEKISKKLSFPKYATTEKLVGETPLVATERLRKKLHIPVEIPLAYAGRLDPMASGKLLVLIGDECKRQGRYHSFDKEYAVEILIGASSDTGDVLGLVTPCAQEILTQSPVKKVLTKLVGSIELPYPHFSSRTIQGKPLHMWALEGRLGEIEIPIKKSTIKKLKLHNLRTITKMDVLATVREKIETIPEVTDPKKALGADFRRETVREAWNAVEFSGHEVYQVITLTCIASSGTYMRSLAERIAKELGTCGLAYSIHRTQIGRYVPFTKTKGIWLKRF